jgi:hypothetical protein
MIEAADAMVKAANVRLVGWEKIDAGPLVCEAMLRPLKVLLTPGQRQANASAKLSPLT